MANLIRNIGVVLMVGGGALALIQRMLPAMAVAEMAGPVNGMSPIAYVIFRTLDGPQALAFYAGAILYGLSRLTERRRRPPPS